MLMDHMDGSFIVHLFDDGGNNRECKDSDDSDQLGSSENT